VVVGLAARGRIVSVPAVTWALYHAACDDPTQRLVLIALAEHANPLGRDAAASVKNLAFWTGVSERTVQRHLRLLEERGNLLRGNQGIVAYIRADRRPVVYDLPIAERGDRLSPRSDGRGDTHDADGVTSTSPEPTTEPRDTPQPLTGLAPPRDRKGHRLPEDWEPEQALGAWACEQLGSGVAVEREIAQFRDYWHAKAGRDACKLDWPKTFRVWIRRAAQDAAQNRSSRNGHQRASPGVVEGFYGRDDGPSRTMTADEWASEEATGERDDRSLW
jgi:DNA-binding transcriptional ArsR family regulator